MNVNIYNYHQNAKSKIKIKDVRLASLYYTSDQLAILAKDMSKIGLLQVCAKGAKAITFKEDIKKSQKQSLP